MTHPVGHDGPQQGASRARRGNDQLDGWVRGTLQRASRNRGVGRMIIALVLAFGLFVILNPRVFLNPFNLQNIAVSSPEIGVLAIAMMLAMLTGGIDLSLVSVANLSAIAMSTIFTAAAASSQGGGESLTPLLVLVGLGVGLLCGLLNGLLIGVVGITPILATLGTMQLLNGIAVIWTGGRTLYGAPAAFSAFGNSALGPIPMLFITLVVIAVLVAVVVNRTSLGQRIQLEGANPVAARYSGIRSRRVLISTYAMTGTLAGAAGILFLARNPTASADYGKSYVLLVIVIAVLGGTNPSGGFATVAGVVLATLTLQVVASGFTSLRLSSYQYAIAQGVILIAVMIIDAVSWSTPWRRRRPTSAGPGAGGSRPLPAAMTDVPQ